MDTHHDGGAKCVECDTTKLPWSTWAMVALFVVAALAGLAAAVFKLQDARKRFRGFVRSNHDSLGRLSDTFTVAWVTMQTLVLVVQNHKDSGGEDAPNLYMDWLSNFDGIVTFEFLAIFPGTDCLYKGYIWSLMGKTLAAMAFTAICLALYYYKKRSGDKMAWRVLKKLVWVSKLLLPAISLTISRTFRCNVYDEDESTEIKVLLVDQSVDCDSSDYQLIFVYAIIMVVLFPGGHIGPSPTKHARSHDSTRTHTRTHHVPAPPPWPRRPLPHVHTLPTLVVGVPLIWLIKLHALRERFEATGKVQGVTRETLKDATASDSDLAPHLNDKNDDHDRASSSKMVVDMEDPVLSDSPLQSLFRGIKPRYAAYYEVFDMTRRLALTCGTMVADSLAGFVLFSLSVAMLSLLAHTQLLPFDTHLMDNMNSVAHWQVLIALVVLLIRDASMFEDTEYEIVGLVLIATNLLMLCMLLIPVVPQLRAEINKVIDGGKTAMTKRRRQTMAQLSSIPGVHVLENPSFRGSQGGHEGRAEAKDRSMAAEVEMSEVPDRSGTNPLNVDIEVEVEVDASYVEGETGGIEGPAMGFNPMHAAADRRGSGAGGGVMGAV
mmetsp:Transcript_103803/g.298825  ORF Transcript_103803/g.298825 Transcript_103803/m.298825 type:complete len:604 (-) Transcript_103803:141-1952(-)